MQKNTKTSIQGDKQTSRKADKQTNRQKEQIKEGQTSRKNIKNGGKHGLLHSVIPT